VQQAPLLKNTTKIDISDYVVIRADGLKIRSYHPQGKKPLPPLIKAAKALSINDAVIIG
jgi:hypothetical protein